MMKHSVSHEFREFCLAKYPVLRENKRLRSLFRYLCFASFHDEDTSQLVIPFRVLHHEIAPEIRERDFNATKLLEELRDRALPQLTWTSWSRTGRGWHGTARRIINDGFDAETRARRDAELVLHLDGNPFVGMVEFDTGEGFRSFRRDKVGPEAWANHRALLEAAELNPTQAKLIDCLDELDGGRLFLPRLVHYKDEIEAAIATIEKPKVVSIQRRILAAIQEQPQVFYRPSPEGRTCRLNACGDTVVHLKKNVRKAFCTGWTECDLRASQFAILAATLDAPVSKALIARGENLWRSLYLHTHQVDGIPPDALKKIFKEAVYSVAYGKTAANLGRFLRRHDLERLINHPVFQELLQLRTEWFARIDAAGGAEDVWGTWHAIRPAKECAPGERPRLARHIAATVIQSIEMEIIAPIFDVARTHGETYQFDIVLFQHDGATISFRAHGKRKEKAMSLLREAVDARAEALGVQTTLEFANLGAPHTPEVMLGRDPTVEEIVAELERDLFAGGHITEPVPEPCFLCGKEEAQLFEGECIYGWTCDGCWYLAVDAEDRAAFDREQEESELVTRTAPAFPMMEPGCLFL